MSDQRIDTDRNNNLKQKENDSKGLRAGTGSQRVSSGFVWNTIGGILNAGQSVFLLMIITRVCGIEAAGIFSIAFATGNLFMYLGNYGVRNYQVSDLSEKYSFSDYIWHRLLTVLLMLLCSTIYTVWGRFCGGYSSYKAGCVAAMCCLKSVDCLEEVFEGRYQQRGRLDRSGKLVTFRLLVSIGGMMVSLVVTRDLLLSTWVGVILAAAASVFMIMMFRSTAAWKRETLKARRIGGLMKECLPVCAANFLSFYLINEPKYAIDAAMDETAQACYNFIAMPVFVIQLLNMFLYQPLLVPMTECWDRHDIRKFVSYFIRIAGSILLVAAPVILLAWAVGIPVLSWLYATDLSTYRTDLDLILVGGTFLAFNGFYCAVLTITRAQNRIPFVYAAAAVVTLFLTPRMVKAYGIRGAVLAFILIMALVTVLLSWQFIRTLRKAGDSGKIFS